MNRNRTALGIDFGRVIITPGDDTLDTSFLRGTVEDAMKTPPFPGAFDTIAELTRQFENRVWIISKAGKVTQEKTRLWLTHHDFWNRTGMNPDRLIFCRQRHEKAIHCKQHAITHFIDDRIGVLRHLDGLVQYLYLFGEQRPGFDVPDWVTHIRDWKGIREVFSLEQKLA